MPEPAKKPCPICGKALHARYAPFCSARCANIDLGRWLNEGYRIPTKSEADEEDGTDRERDDEGPI